MKRWAVIWYDAKSWANRAQWCGTEEEARELAETILRERVSSTVSVAEEKAVVHIEPTWCVK